VATPAEIASTEDPTGACDEEAEVMPAGKRPPETEINGLKKIRVQELIQDSAFN
jgi:hypothetical protein